MSSRIVRKMLKRTDSSLKLWRTGLDMSVVEKHKYFQGQWHHFFAIVLTCDREDMPGAVQGIDMFVRRRNSQVAPRVPTFYPQVFAKERRENSNRVVLELLDCNLVDFGGRWSYAPDSAVPETLGTLGVTQEEWSDLLFGLQNTCVENGTKRTFAGRNAREKVECCGLFLLVFALVLSIPCFTCLYQFSMDVRATTNSVEKIKTAQGMTRTTNDQNGKESRGAFLEIVAAKRKNDPRKVHFAEPVNEDIESPEAPPEAEEVDTPVINNRKQDDGASENSAIADHQQQEQLVQVQAQAIPHKHTVQTETYNTESASEHAEYLTAEEGEIGSRKRTHRSLGSLKQAEVKLSEAKSRLWWAYISGAVFLGALKLGLVCRYAPGYLCCAGSMCRRSVGEDLAKKVLDGDRGIAIESRGFDFKIVEKTKLLMPNESKNALGAKTDSNAAPTDAQQAARNEAVTETPASTSFVPVRRSMASSAFNGSEDEGSQSEQVEEVLDYRVFI